MSRIRTVKPDFWGSPKTARVSRDARLLFIGLLNESDDEGRQLGSPRRIAGALFPHDDDVSTRDVARWLDELEAASMIQRYEANGGKYLLICGFTEHQKVSHPTESKLPTPPEELPETIANSSGDAPEVLSPDLGSGNGSRKGIIAPSKSAREDLLWNAVMFACAIGDQIPNNARGAYNKALKELRDVGADPDEVPARAAMYRVRWPNTSLTPNALARHWAELEPNGQNMPGAQVPKSFGALVRVMENQRDP